MADSRRELLVQQVANVLGAMSQAAGYENDYPGGVSRFQREGTALNNPPTVVVSLIQDVKDNRSEHIITGTAEIAVEVFAVDAGDLGESTGAYLDSLAQDVEKAIGSDSTMGGYATHCYVETVRPFGLIDGLPYVGVNVKVMAEYRHARGAPETGA